MRYKLIEKKIYFRKMLRSEVDFLREEYPIIEDPNFPKHLFNYNGKTGETHMMFILNEKHYMIRILTIPQKRTIWYEEAYHKYDLTNENN